MDRTWRTRIDGLSQRSRRVICIATMAGLPAMFGWYAFWHGTGASSLLWGPVSFLLILVTLVGALILYSFVRDRSNRDARLDERQLQLRDRAWILCYEFLSVLVVSTVLILGVLVLGLGKTVTLDGSTVTALVICAGVLIPLLPVAALAWVEPDPPGES